MKKLISALFIVFLKIFEPIRSNGSIKISERFDLKTSHKQEVDILKAKIKELELKQPKTIIKYVKR